ncbi:ARF GAP-like zinc finger-containing protein ZIGA4 isoform X2 [Wolffia australiana]
MSSKREEEKNEKIIRGLMKLPPNRRCINCNSLGPQYVCTNFWTFVCMTCSGIHREFTHRVKSVSMAKFTSTEVEALQNGGNQRAREIFLLDWDFQSTRLPDSSKPDRIREFIKSVYVEKLYSGGKSSDKPPRTTQSQKGFVEDHRRASSYHSYSQSPPYDYQYEDRRYGKQSGMLSRKPGSERGSFGKLSNLIYSPGQQAEQMYEDRFSNEISDPRLSDFSRSSDSDILKVDGQSPNFQKDSIFVSNPQPVRDILNEDGTDSVAPRQSQTHHLSHPQRSASLGSLGLFDGNSVPLRSVNSSGSQEFAVQSLQPTRSLPGESSFSSQLQPSLSNLPSEKPEPSPLSSLDLFGEVKYSSMNISSSFDQEVEVSSSTAVVDFFAEFPPPLSKPTLENSTLEPFPREEGWATFELSPPVSVPESKPTSFISGQGSGNQIQKTLEQSSLAHESSPSVHSQWSPVTGGLELPFDVATLQPSDQSSLAREPFPLVHNQWSSATSGVDSPFEAATNLTWNAFGESFSGLNLSSFETSMPTNDVQVTPHVSSAVAVQPADMKFQKDFDLDVLQLPSIDDRTMETSFFSSGPSMGISHHELKSTNPFDVPYDSDPETFKFLDMAPLQATLPSVQFPPPFSNLGQPWFPQSPMPPFIAPAASAGSVSFMGGGQPPTSQLPDLPAQGSVSSIRGNPFA